MAVLSDYDPEEVLACRNALMELVRSFGELGNEIVLIGGWIPYYLCGERGLEEHVGSLDNDVVIEFSAVQDTGTGNQIRGVLRDLNYNNQYPEPSHRFFKNPLPGSEPQKRIILDLFTGDEGPRIPWSKERELQDEQLWKLRGANLVFNNPVEVDLTQYSPEKTDEKISIRVANPAVFIVLKALALGSETRRGDFKDAYDIWFLLEHYLPGLETILDLFSPIRDDEMVREAIGILNQEYADIEQAGPTGAAKFQDNLLEGSGEYERVRRKAYESVQYLLKGIQDNETPG